jgi:hypothetical protein
MRIANRWFMLVVGSCVLALLATVASTGDALSMVPLLWFLAVIPGLPFVLMLRTRQEPAAFWLTAVALSISIDAVVAEVLLYTDAYSAEATVFVLVGIAYCGAAVGRFLAIEHEQETAHPARVRSGRA